MNAPVPQRIKMMEVEQLWQRIIALESANGKCGEAIAAAVAAEREACAKVATKAIMHVNTSTARSRDWTMAELKGYCADAAEKAIRARNGNGGKGELGHGA